MSEDSDRISMLEAQVETLTALVQTLPRIDPHSVSDVSGPSLDIEEVLPAGTFRAELTSAASPYSWKEREWDAGTNDWQDLAGGRTGTTDAYEQTKVASLKIGLQVWMRQLIDDAGTVRYIFDIPLDDQTASLEDLTVAMGGTDGTRTALTARTASWDIADGSNLGCKFTCSGPVAWDPTLKVLYGYWFDVYIAPGGHGFKVTAETRYDIDNLVPC